MRMKPRRREGTVCSTLALRIEAGPEIEKKRLARTGFVDEFVLV